MRQLDYSSCRIFFAFANFMNPLIRQLNLQKHIETAATVLWGLAAVLTHGIAPWFFWITMLALPAFAIVRAESSYLRSPVGRRILLVCLVMLVLHVGWALGRSHFYDASVFGTYWKDDHNYFREAKAIAGAWGAGEYPEIGLKGSPPYLGTLHTGYHRPLSTLFLIFGSSTICGLLLNAVCAACFPLFCALISRYLWSPDSEGGADTLRSDYGLIAGILAALHPTQFYWASYLMKDTYVAFVFLAGLTLVLGAYRRKSTRLAVGALFVLPYMFTVRAYTAMGVVAGAALLPFMRLKRKILIRSAAIGALFLVLIGAYTTGGNAIFRQLRDSFLALAPPDIGTPSQLLLGMAAGIPRLFLAPYAWLILPEPTPMYGMYPGMWYFYLLIYPLAFAGLYQVVRKNISAAVVPLAVLGLSALIFLSAVYQGEASRQRFSLEFILIVFAAYGMRNFSRAWAFTILSLEAAFAVGQVLSLR